ncbi:hypothetical protein ACLQ28_07545 [Micromonospora sp. DT201]|uniref:hypothetical protein n=1 Tax=Micromonospora sp. DT201 TaxID=3393442 RepID=UPI003CF64521
MNQRYGTQAAKRAATDLPATDTELLPDLPPADLGLLPGDADEYLVTGGGLNGQRGSFTRDEAGAITGIDLAGRLFTRVPR